MSNFDLQSSFFYQAKEKQIPLTLFLVNGVPLKGKIVSYDQYTLSIDTDGEMKLIFKSAISTIIAEQLLDLFE